MIENYNNVGYSITSGLSTFYTCPSGFDAVINFCQIANADASTHNVNMAITISGITRYLAYDVEVPVQASLAPLSANLVLQAGDTLSVQTDADDVLDLTMSVVEIRNA